MFHVSEFLNKLIFLSRLHFSRANHLLTIRPGKKELIGLNDADNNNCKAKRIK